MNKWLRKSGLFLKRNSSTILTGVGAVGVVGTAVLAVKATPKAMALLEKAEEQKGEKLTKFEVVRVAGPAYIPAVVTGASTIACIFGANALNKKQQAALMSAYAMVDSSYKEYKKKVEELYGEGTNQQVVAEIAKDKYNENDISVDYGKSLFYDEFSGRYFEAATADVIRAEYKLNERISKYGGVALNEFYELLDIEPVDYGEFLGWSSGGLMEMYWESWLDFVHEKVIMDDGLECHIIRFGVEPMYDYEYY